MRPDLATIVVVGNVSAQQVRASIERAFGGWHATGPMPVVELAGGADQPARRREGPLAEHPPGLCDARTAVPLPRSAPQFYPLLLGNTVLGGGSLGPEQSRLFRDIRQNAGLVYSIDSQYVSGGARSRFSVEFACAQGNEGRIESLVNDEIVQLRKEPIGDFELR